MMVGVSIALIALALCWCIGRSVRTSRPDRPAAQTPEWETQVKEWRERASLTDDEYRAQQQEYARRRKANADLQAALDSDDPNALDELLDRPNDDD